MIYLFLHLVPRKTFTVIQDNPLDIEANALASRLQSIRAKNNSQWTPTCKLLSDGREMTV